MSQLTIQNLPELPYALQEAVNRLRININFLGNEIKKILVISTFPNEGKSFVALQLWQQMAESGSPSILLDTDLRKSVMVEQYGMALQGGGSIKGTSYVLANDISIEDAIFHTNMECGDILPNVDNVVNPSMLLESERFEQMLAYMGEKYRYVFVDAPPLDLVSDGEKIGSLCDGAVLVVRSGVTSRGMVKNSIRQLERAGCPLLGIVLNRVESAKSGYYYKKYGGGKYYGSRYYSNSYYYK